MFRYCLIALVVLMTLAGCSDSGPDVVPIEGTLTLDGEPLANKSLLFTAMPGTTGHGASGMSDANGKYTLTAVVPGATRDYQGIEPGSYRVTVFEPTFSGTAVVEDIGEEPAVALAPEMSGRKSTIPRIYSSDRSPLILEVPEAGGSLDVTLLSKPN